MKWLARLKQIDTAPEAEATEPTKPGFVGFVAPIWAPVQKTGGDSPAANDSTPDPDRWCWPSSKAMTGREIDTFTARLSRSTDKGLSLDDAEALADKLVIRDRDTDDRRLCLECQHLAGQAAGSWRCRNWQRAGVAIQSRDAGIPGELVIQLQHCDGFKGVTT
jgi:hypothetical protein